MPEATLKLTKRLPEFRNLPGVEGKSHSSKEYSGENILVVLFSCNHCPYVRAYEDRIIALQREYGPRGVQVVAINSNDTKNYPEDSFDKMVLRAKEKGFNFPYLRDDDQSVAEAFGATHTPQFFVFDRERKLRYSGRMDDNWEHPAAVKENYLRDALGALLAGKDVPIPETYSIGCTIKWG